MAAASHDEHTVTSTLVGRGPERDQLRAWCAEQSAPLLVISGAAGIGKTHLATSFLGESTGVVVVGLTGTQPTDNNAFVPLTRGLLGAAERFGVAPAPEVLAELTPLIPDRDSPTEATTPPSGPGRPRTRTRRRLDLNRINDRPHHRAFAHLAAAVAEASTEPVLLLVDDLQWAGPAASHLLRDLVLNPPHPDVSILATCRPDPPANITALLQELEQSTRLQTMSLAGLPVEAVGELIARRGVAAAESTQLAESLMAMTQGNPLLVETVIASSAVPGRPVELRDAVAAQLVEFAPAVQEAITLLAVAGRSAREATLEEGLRHLTPDAPQVDLRTLLQPAVAAGLVEHHSNTQSIRFTHDEYREAALSTLDQTAVTGHHAAMARTLGSSTDTDGSSHVHHLVHAGAAPAAVAGAAAEAADRAFAADQWDEAIPLLRIALSTLREITEPSSADPDTSALLPRLAEAQRRTAHPDADATVAEAFADAQQRADLDTMIHMALLRPRTGDFSLLGGVDQEVFGRLEICLDLIDPTARPGDAALLCAAMSEELLFAPDSQRRELAERAVELAAASAEPTIQSVAMLARRNTMSAPAELDDRIRAGRELVEQATKSRNQWDLAWAHMALSGNLLERGDRDGYELRVDLADDINQQLRSRYIEYILATRRTSSLIMNAEFDRAELQALADMRLGESAGFDVGYTLGLYGSQMAKIRTAQGRATELVESFEFMVDQVPTFLAYRAALSWILAEARSDAVGRHVELVARDDFAHVPLDYWWVTTLSLVGRSAAIIGDLDTARSALEKLIPYSGQIVWSGTVALGPVDWQLGGLAGALGDMDAAIHWLERTETQCVRAGMRCSLHSVSHELAAVRGGQFTAENLLLTPWPAAAP